MHHQQAAQPVAACGDADVFILRIKQQVPRLYFVPLYVHAVGVLFHGSAALPDHIRRSIERSSGRRSHTSMASPVGSMV